jgi:hypothetical protein
MEDFPIDDEEPANDLPLFDEEAEDPESETLEDENPEEESIFEEEGPENFLDPVLEDPDLSGEEDLPLEPEIPPEPIAEEEELPPAEELPRVEEGPSETAPPVQEADSAPVVQTAVAAAPRREEESPRFKKDDMLGLMNYLKTLATSLPHKDRDAFMQSDARLSMEYIIDMLEGRKGLILDIETRLPGIAGSDAAASPVPSGGPVSPAPSQKPPPQQASAQRAPSGKAPSGKMAALRAASDAEEAAAGGKPKKRKKPDLAGMLAFLAKLAGELPDPGLGKAISRKVDTVITDIKHSKNE